MIVTVKKVAKNHWVATCDKRAGEGKSLNRAVRKLLARQPSRVRTP